MNGKIKYLLTFGLVAFASFTFAFQVAKEFRTTRQITLSEGLNVICTHATTRCPTCLAMEKLTRELLDSDFVEMIKAGKIVFREVNYEHSGSNDFSNEYKVATAAVVLVNVRDGKAVAGVNLANEAWKRYTDAPAFKAMLKEHIEAMLQGRIVETDDSTEEIDLEGEDIELNLIDH